MVVLLYQEVLGKQGGQIERADEPEQAAEKEKGGGDYSGDMAVENQTTNTPMIDLGTNIIMHNLKIIAIFMPYIAVPIDPAFSATVSEFASLCCLSAKGDLYRSYSISGSADVK
ncbi:MAG: hypothetical protein V2J65_38055 [Desulfobacteraceae bacterium]|jgi:hypothetical protein|nr:hypothetical protein [Desulfobacteraceae bacterium]